jgi:SAM-dependent methyltransferase
MKKETESVMDNTEQTKKVFKDKWTNNTRLGYLDILDANSEITKWVLNRNGWKNLTDLEKLLSPKLTILDAGCGNGRITALFSKLSPESNITGWDINPETAQHNLSQHKNVQILKHDLMNPNSAKFDFIYSQEVLHHVENPKLAFENLVNSLNIEGTIAIYVYKKKAPIREFTDEYIRSRIRNLSYEEALKLMSDITNFGKKLSELNIAIEIDEVKILEIPSGKYDLQRLFYHFFAKCFWNDGLTKEENDAINFDWYGPQLASKHTMQEILSWFEDCELDVTHQLEDEYGITVHGKKTKFEKN